MSWRLARPCVFSLTLLSCTTLEQASVDSDQAGGTSDVAPGSSDTSDDPLDDTASDPDAGTGSADGDGSDDDETGGDEPGGCVKDDDCDDGVFCNGTERCAGRDANADTNGCVSGDNPCPASKTCSERFALCVGRCAGDPDADNDGEDSVACGGADCNDRDPEINPGAVEVCDGNGVDEDCDPTTTDDDFLGSEAHCSACGDACGDGTMCLDGGCSSARRVFLTSETYGGDFGGAQVADNACQQLADEAGLGGSWLAYIIDDFHALSRHNQNGGPFRKLDGVIVANDWLDLADGSIQSPLDLTEQLQTPGGNAWTGLAAGSAAASLDCSNWSQESDDCLDTGLCGGAGQSNETDISWEGIFIFNCNASFRFYCIEQ